MEYEAREKAIRDHKQLLYEARQQGIEQEIKAMILDNLEEKILKERIFLKLQKNFSLTEKVAKEYYGKFAENDD